MKYYKENVFILQSRILYLVLYPIFGRLQIFSLCCNVVSNAVQVMTDYFYLLDRIYSVWS